MTELVSFIKSFTIILIFAHVSKKAITLKLSFKWIFALGDPIKYQEEKMAISKAFTELKVLIKN